MGDEINTKETSAEAPKLSVLEETKQAIAELKKEKEDIEKINEELKQLRSDQLLSGTGGGHVAPVVKEETDQEYVDKMRKNGWKADA